MYGGGLKLKLKCLHGFFIFQETNIGQMSDFMSLTGLTVVPFGKDFTFEFLADAPDYSLAGKTMLGIPAIKTFAGKPWEIFEANGFIYDFDKGLVRPIELTTDVVSIEAAGNRFVSPGLIMPGSLTADGNRVKDYSAWYYSSRQRWLYSEVSYV